MLCVPRSCAASPCVIERTIVILSAIRAMFGTFSPWIALPPDRRTLLLGELGRIADEQFGGTVTRPYHTVVLAARRP